MGLRLSEELTAQLRASLWDLETAGPHSTCPFCGGFAPWPTDERPYPDVEHSGGCTLVAIRAELYHKDDWLDEPQPPPLVLGC